MVPDIQGRQAEALWDTGAQVSLITDALADDLVTRGARLQELPSGINIRGVGEGTLVAKRQLIATLRLKDGKPRTFIALIVPHCMYEMIIGLDFMQYYGIAFAPSPDGSFQLLDLKVTGHPIIYTQSHDKTSPKQDNVAVDVVQQGLRRKPRKAGKKGFRKLQEYWKGIPEENRTLIKDLAQVRLASATVEEAKQRFKNTEFTGLDVDFSVAATGPSKLQIPQCDHPPSQQALEDLIRKYSSVFSTEGSDVGKTQGRRATIALKTDRPVNVRNYRTPLKLRTVMRGLIDELLAAGIIEKSETSEFNSPCLLVPKKLENGKSAGHRLVIDYRALNKVIENVVYPMPRIQDILAEFSGCKYFSNVDVHHAYYNVELEEHSRKLTAFGCEFGKWQFRFLPQGLKISPAIFQDRINHDLRGLRRTRPYMDDILTGDETPEAHLQTLERMFARLQDTGYKLKLSKCDFLKLKVTFVGSDVSGDGVSVSESKRARAADLKTPQTLAHVRALLGFTNFLREHVPYYADVVAPIQALLSVKNQTKHMKITHLWTPKHDRALQILQELLKDPAVLAFPDTSKPFILYTDASGQAMSAVLFQENASQKLCPIGYWSKAFKGSQVNWSALVKEARAVYEAVLHYEVFLIGCHVTLRCDHKPLLRFLEATTHNDMVNRWSLDIQRFDIQFEWVESEANVSDCLSRLGAENILERSVIADTDTFPQRPKVKDQVIVRNRRCQAAPPRHSQGSCTHDVARAHISDVRREPTVDEEADLMGVDGKTHSLELSRLTDAQFKALQERDGYCRRIVKQIPTSTDDNGDFVVKDGLLYRIFYPTTEGTERLPGFAVVVPRVLWLSVVLNLHKELAHAGRDKMMAALRSRVYWKGMDRSVAAFVKGCKVCQFRQLKSNTYRQMRVKPPRGPGIRLAVDVWSCSYGSLLTAIDLHSQYPFAEVIDDKSASSVCNAMQNILAAIRSPLEILTDNGGEFCGHKFQNLLRARGILHVTTAPYSPNANGIVERFHRFLNAVVRMTTNLSREGDWWPSVRGALETYRKIPHSASGEAPLFLFMGQEPTYCIDHLLPTLSRQMYIVTDHENVLDLEQLRTAHALARKNLCLARRKSKGARPHNPDPPLKVGDRVYKKSHEVTKLDLPWQPGFRIVGFKSSRTAIVEHTETKIKVTVNVRDLRWADPISELIQNTSVDAFPGRSKLYFRADDLEDLDWEAIRDLPELDPALAEKADEIVRNRRHDHFTQEPPAKVPRLENGEALDQCTHDSHNNTQPDSSGPTGARQSKRQRRRPDKLDDYLSSFPFTAHPLRVVPTRAVFATSVSRSDSSFAVSECTCATVQACPFQALLDDATSRAVPSTDPASSAQPMDSTAQCASGGGTESDA